MRLRRILPVLVASAAITVGAPAVTSAAPVHRDQPVVSDPVVAAMGRDLGVTPERVAPRLAKEAAGGRLEQRVRQEVGAAFAGAWLDSSTELVVAVTDEAAARTARLAGAKTTVVRWGADQLAAVKRALDAKRSVPDAVTGWYVDVSSNSVVVTALAPGAADVRAFAGTAPQVRVVRAAERAQVLHDVRGGDPYYFNGGSRCSIGFSVQGGYVTAGHCGTAGTATNGFNQVAQGAVERSNFPGDDMGWVRTNANWTPRPVVVSGSSTVTVRGSTEAAIGASVCRSGSTTGWRCGTIQAKNETVNYPQGTVQGLTRTNACAEPGDSGGSWLTGDQAQGVTSGGSGNCSSGGTTYFQPVNEILQRYGLTLTVDSPPQPPVTPADSGSVTGDFTGDGKADVLSLYDYGDSTTGLWVFPGTSGSGDTAASPYRAWLSGPGGWTASRGKITTGDFTGDGKTDLLALYDYGNSVTGLWVFPGATAQNPTSPYQVWLSGAGAFTWANTKISAGDFTGDGKADVTAIYDYGASTTGLFIFPGTSGSTTGPYRAWLSGAGGFTWSNTKIATGDFTGDGKADVAALYDYGASTTGLFIAPGTAATGDSASQPYRVWLSGTGGFTWSNSKIAAGDFTGDGKSDVTVLYDYGASTSGLFVFPGTGGSASSGYRVWLSGAGGFTWSNAKITSGDFTGDRKADVAVLYDYGASTAGLFIAPGTTATGDSASSPYRVWLSGAGGWDWKKGQVA
ncbi:hypothetical protein JOD54_004659 [Actinokineospora baliensis]|uniref:FG-GAP-like repeat-containing protein n=1 Tax=Actinokineospora baliensis TaxID=547056 RepID=UPI00195A22D1|nr:FG-GAP-like repeat-containing protein [Actinokineospora baliensis]MBM7774455.1 hypothetical protein [Actinokineospora baliensis]